MINIPEGCTVPVQDLINIINAFLVDLCEADTKRGGERVVAFLKLANDHELLPVGDAVNFATLDINSHLEA